MSTAAILCEERDDVAFVTIRNDAKLNAMNVAMWSDLRERFLRFAQSETLRCIVVTGAGDKAFSAGADISEFETTRTTREQVTRFHEEGVGAALGAMLACDVPVVAAIRGTCMGGGLEIASACDIRLADDTARFGAPVGRLGFPLAFGETQGLFRLVGPTVAAELLVEGRILSAAEALDRRLVTRLARRETLDDAVDEAVRNVCASGLWAARSHKRQLRRLMADPSPVTFEERREVYGFAETTEYRAGIERFRGRKGLSRTGD